MNKEENNSAYKVLKRFQSFRYVMILEGVLVGIGAGLISILYRIMIEKAEWISGMVISVLKLKLWLIPVWFAILVVIAIVVGRMVKKEPMISGSGIPQVEGEMDGHFDANWLKVTVSKFIGGIACMGAGLSLGREGPSIQLGAMVAKGISKVMKLAKMEEKFLITCGASAGLAAAFNAPLAGIMFALEEIHKNFSEVMVLSVMAASLIADFLSKNMFGLEPVFTFNIASPVPLKMYWLVVLLGVITGLLGGLYNYTLAKSQDLYKSVTFVKPEYRLIIPFVIAGALGFVMPEVLGGGHRMVEILMDGQFVVKSMLALVIVKFTFSMVSFGSGAPGGIFFPLLVIGAYIGGIYGSLAAYEMVDIDQTMIYNFIILGMVGYFTAIVRAPITGVILITEMTGSFTYLLALSIVAIVSYVTASAIKSVPVYEMLLSRMVKNKGQEESGQDGNGAKVLAEYGVELGCTADGRLIREVMWPKDCLIVTVKRGGSEIMPGGNTSLRSGDILVIMADEGKLPDIMDGMRSVCRNVNK